MKPTVINNSNNENSHQPQQNPQNVNNNQTNNGQTPNDHSRRFPQFRQHGFGFNDPDDDVFADMGLRSRLNRMGNPFDWSARKRRGSGQGSGQGSADAYDHYFDDVDFPHFGSTWDAFGRMGNKRAQQPDANDRPHDRPHDRASDRSGFFDYVPQEFRQYVPEHFGSYFRRGGEDRPPHGYSQQHPQQEHHQKQQQPQQHQQPPPQHHAQQQPQSQQPNAQQSGPRSNLCDAAIQTDDLGAPSNGERRPDPVNNNEHGNRNGDNINRSSSSASSSSTSTPYGNQVHMSTSTDGPGAYANASAGNNQNQYYQQSPQYGSPPYGTPPAYGRYQQPHAQYSQSPQQNQFYASPPSQEGFVRNVPIVIESTGTRVNAAQQAAAPQPSTTKARPEPLNKESFASNVPIPCPPPASHDQQQSQQHSENQDPNNADSAPPQTPHTADCISKIQAIQRDVLELMLAVEQFGGKRGDKDYIYLDEMLTRNLLKLDTIDTNGKESIRLARKEAIKCIQTSIAVLEAKSDLHLNENKDNADQNTEPTADGAAAPEKPADNTEGAEETSGEAAKNGADDIPKVENISIDDKTSNDNDSSKTAQPAAAAVAADDDNNTASESVDAKK